jgi:hypothetical protein
MQLIFKTVWSVVRQGRRKQEHKELEMALTADQAEVIDLTEDVAAPESLRANRAG